MAGSFFNNIADTLGFGPKNLVGLDIGLNSVKVCELQYNPNKRDQYKLVKFAFVDLPEGALIEDEIQKPDEIVEAIKLALKKSKIKIKNACMGMSGPNTMSKRIQLPGGSDEEIEDQVLWESEQFIPFGVDDSTVSYHVIGENAGGGVDVLIAAARNDIVQSFRDLATEAGLDIKVVDLDMFALINSFEHVLKGQTEKYEGSCIVIDFGAQKSDLIIHKNDSILFTREMNIGGVLITEEIQRQLGLNYEEAEGLKIRGDDNGNLPEEIVEIIDAVLESFFSEIKKTLNFYMTASSDEDLTRCYITGGSALIPGFMEGLESVMGMEVSILNPFDKFTVVDNKFDEATLERIASSGLIALGLAMRSL